MSRYGWVALGIMRHVMARKRRLLVSLAAIQMVFSAAIMWGIPLIAGGATDAQRFLTAAWHLGLLVIGLAVAPQEMAEWKIDGYFEELQQLPLPRPVLAMAELLSWIVTMLPGIVLTPLLAWAGFGILPVHIWTAGFVLLIAALIYLGIGMILMLFMPLEGVQVVSQILMVFAMLLSPILYPASRLPHWIEAVHAVLPFMPVNTTLMNAVSGHAIDAGSLTCALVWAVAATILAAAALVVRKKGIPITKDA